MDSIVKDLKSLEKQYVESKAKAQNQMSMAETKIKMLENENTQSKNGLKDMKWKIELLKKQNLKLKSDLDASNSDKMLYYNQYQKYGREVRVLQAKIKSLESSETSKSYDFQAILDSKVTKM